MDEGERIVAERHRLNDGVVDARLAQLLPQQELHLAVEDTALLQDVRADIFFEGFLGLKLN